MNSGGGSTYWPEYRDVAELLQAMRRFRMADERMRREMSLRMGMNVTDLQALRLIVSSERTGEAATPRTISEELGISTASTTKLLDRLTQSGHIERRPHPRDRRSVKLAPTAHAHGELQHWLQGAHAQMAEVAMSFTITERELITEFLNRMTDVVAQESTST